MIVSTAGGRIRIRTNRLKSKKISGRLKDRIEALEGVTGVRANPNAHSLIVHFDENRIEMTDLEDQVIEICSPPKNDGNGSNKLTKRLNQASKVGMIATLATSLAYGYAGKKKPHIRFGTAFLALAGVHMLKHSNRLLR